MLEKIYFELEDKDYAIKLYNQNKDVLEKYKGDTSSNERNDEDYNQQQGNGGTGGGTKIIRNNQASQAGYKCKNNRKSVMILSYWYNGRGHEFYNNIC